MGPADGIDWSQFDGVPECSCGCRCGREFRSHAKTVRRGDRWLLVSRKVCPGCGKTDDLRRASTDPESWTLRG